jgi:hypothetical protein
MLLDCASLWMSERRCTCVCEVLVIILEEGAVLGGVGLFEEGLVFYNFELNHFYFDERTRDWRK